MRRYEPHEIATSPQVLLAVASFAVQAHANRAREPKKATRLWDRQTTYGVHPLQCAMSVLQESKLQDNLRGCVAWILMYHDLLEDTALSVDELPPETPLIVVSGVKQKTFPSTLEEQKNIWECSSDVILATLYDKRSNLLDNDWMRDDKLVWYSKYVLDLCAWAENRYGLLNVVVEAKALVASKLEERGLASRA